MSSIPQWKQALLERRRRQDEEARKRHKQELQKLSHMPAWKRDLILKRKGFLNSDSISLTETVYSKTNTEQNIPSNIYANNVTENGDIPDTKSNENGDVESDIHATPFESNSDSCLTNGFELVGSFENEEEALNSRLVSNQSNNMSNIPINSDLSVAEDIKSRPANSVSKRCDSWDSETDVKGTTNLVTSQTLQDQEAEEEEMQYQPGFVHKLLGKFIALSKQDQSEQQMPSLRRTHSLENIVDTPSIDEKLESHHPRSNIYIPPPIITTSRMINVNTLSPRERLGSTSPLSQVHYEQDLAKATEILPETKQRQNLPRENSIEGDKKVVEEKIETVNMQDDSLSEEAVVEKAVDEEPKFVGIASTKSKFETLSKPSPKKRRAPPPPNPIKPWEKENASNNAQVDSICKETDRKVIKTEISSSTNNEQVNTINGVEPNVNGSLHKENKIETNNKPNVLKEQNDTTKEILKKLRRLGRSWHYSKDPDNRDIPTNAIPVDISGLNDKINLKVSKPKEKASSNTNITLTSIKPKTDEIPQTISKPKQENKNLTKAAPKLPVPKDTYALKKKAPKVAPAPTNNDSGGFRIRAADHSAPVPKTRSFELTKRSRIPPSGDTGSVTIINIGNDSTEYISNKSSPVTNIDDVTITTESVPVTNIDDVAIVDKDKRVPESCNIVFIGENVKGSRNCMKKTRNYKVSSKLYT
ncbi:unnamed protein product [Owenia fusiformis]|uniref:Uncharacterized protein n=1 Tax=Owenia fusiformis TaxID=6347 RepID=A0A8S4NYL8_OWEFU|nr:unnamed protein product [Owenia fusiformis]